MLDVGPYFWPLFAAVIAGGAALTVLACWLVATFSPSWFRRPGEHRTAKVLHLAPHRGHGEPGQLPRTA